MVAALFFTLAAICLASLPEGSNKIIKPYPRGDTERAVSRHGVLSEPLFQTAIPLRDCIRDKCSRKVNLRFGFLASAKQTTVCRV